MVNFLNLINAAWLIPAFPLFGFMAVLFFNKSFKGNSAGYFSSFMVLLSFITGLIFFFSLNASPVKSATLNLFNWISADKINIPFEFLIDPLSVTMILIITGVGFLIHVYSVGYMHDDPRFNTYFSHLNLFTFAMLILVMGANYLILFIGWEGVGLCSYLLIGFWFSNNNFNYAARKAFIMNRIGDLAFILGIILIYFLFQSFNFMEISSQTGRFMLNSRLITITTLLLFIGATGKSAQIPLYTWLPDAMAGPTPVSALIHAATMVTAGIYMIARSSALFNLAPFTQSVITIIGMTTVLLAAFIALVQNDIKKVLAYSTVSQLGYMFVALGLGAYSASVFHLTTHAFFKALLFLGAGSVIHAMAGEQDIRKMGGLSKKMKITFLTFLVGTLAISGIPPFSGFFSKDEILSQAFQYNPALYSLALLGALLTAFYMFRLLFLVFFGKSRTGEKTALHVHESPPVMTYPLLILAVLALLGGCLNLPEIFGGNAALTSFLSPSIHLSSGESMPLPHSTEAGLMTLSTLLILAVIILAGVLYLRMKKIPPPDEIRRTPVIQWLLRKLYVDEFYNFLLVKPYEFLSGTLYTKLENNLINPLVNGFGNSTVLLSNALRRLQAGNVSFYIFVMVAGILLFLMLNLYI